MFRGSRRSTVMVACLVCVVLLGAYAIRADGHGPDAKSIVVLNLTSGKEDLHAATMGLQLAGHALADGRRVVMFFNVRAPELVIKKSNEHLSFGGNPPIGKMVEDLLKSGAEAMVCPSCMKVMGVDEGELMPGVKVATRESLFASLGSSTVVFSY